jgi:hypothetical protein
MNFEKAVWLVGTVTDLRPIESARVVDHNQLNDEEPRAAPVKSKAQYTATQTGSTGAGRAAAPRAQRQPACPQPPPPDGRALDRCEWTLPNLDTYNFVLCVAWRRRHSVSRRSQPAQPPRRHLRGNEFEHRILEAKLRRFHKTRLGSRSQPLPPRTLRPKHRPHHRRLKALTDDWSAPTHENRETPYPLGRCQGLVLYWRRSWTVMFNTDLHRRSMPSISDRETYAPHLGPA